MIKRPKETKLKKEFTEKAVNRLRNLVQGKYGEKVSTQVGYEIIEEFHTEGDVWEENGKSWTIKNGLKQNVTKLDSIKKFVKTPLTCPECSSGMKHKNDKKMFILHGKCSTCVSKIESIHKLNGTYDKYIEDFVKSNMKTDVEESQQFIKEFSNSVKDSFITEDGDLEEHTGDIDKNKVLEKWYEELEEMKKLLSS